MILFHAPNILFSSNNRKGSPRLKLKKSSRKQKAIRKMRIAAKYSLFLLPVRRELTLSAKNLNMPATDEAARALRFIKEDKKLLFNVTGLENTKGFCNITIPHQLLGGPHAATLDGQPLSSMLTLDNGTHTRGSASHTFTASTESRS